MKILQKSVLGIAALGPALTAAQEKSAAPNFLICVADDASFDFWSKNGCEWLNTPSFDRVASEGVQYTNCYTVCAKSTPSRSCLLTGKYIWQLGEAANHICNFPEDEKVFPEVLSENGYFVGYTSKGWGPGNPGMKNGEVRQLTGIPYNSRLAVKPTAGISTNDYCANFADFLADAGKGRPWCFWFGSREPHRQYEYGTGVTKGKKSLDMIKQVPSFWPDCPEVRTDMLDYAYELEYFDKQIGRMIKMLEDSGQLDNTVVIITSDNGMPFPRCKGNNYEYSHHMPLAVMWKNGIANAGRKEDRFVSFVDVAPTILDLAGIDTAGTGMEDMSGKSFKPNLIGAHDYTAKDYVLIGRERHDNGRPGDQGYPIRGIRSGKWLYLINLKPSLMPGGEPLTGYRDVDSSPTKTAILDSYSNGADTLCWQSSFGYRPEAELYDVETDPECMSNLAGQKVYRSVVKHLDKMLKQELRRQGDPRLGKDGDVFDRYPYDKPGKAGVYEQVKDGRLQKPWLASSWVVPTDYAQFSGYENSFCLEAHRGLSNRFPENTLLAFEMAAQNAERYGGMETDVQMTSDGVLVCMHDMTIDRTTDGTGKVEDYTYAELQNFLIDGGYGWSEEFAGLCRIPLFSDYLRICRESGMKPYVELKNLTEEGVRKTIEMIESFGFTDGYVVTSTNYDYLKIASECCDMPLEYMQKIFTKEDIDKYGGLKNIVIRPSAVYLTESIVRYCRKKGLPIECYCIPVGDKVLLSRLRGWGVTGGTCNDFEGLSL